MSQQPPSSPYQASPQPQGYYPPQSPGQQQPYGYPPQQPYGYPPQQPYGYPPQQVVYVVPPPTAVDPLARKINVLPYILWILMSINDCGATLFLLLAVVGASVVKNIDFEFGWLTLASMLGFFIYDIIGLASKKAGTKPSVALKGIPGYILAAWAIFMAILTARGLSGTYFVLTIILSAIRPVLYISWGLQYHVKFFSYLAPYRYPNLKK